jgi:mRNA interferase MazF
LKPGDIVIGAFAGANVTKLRPAVVLSTELYHLHRPDVIVGLITTQTPHPLAPTDCELFNWKTAGLHGTSFFRLYLFTVQRRQVRLIGHLSDSDWKTVQSCFRAGFDGN